MNTLKVEIEMQIPDWVNWMAADANGAVWGYGTKPKKCDGYWADGGESQQLYQNKPPENWKDELYEWK